MTLDIGTTLFIFVTYILFLKFIERMNLYSAILLGLGVGLALASRIFAIPVLGISMVLVWISFFKKKSGIVFIKCGQLILLSVVIALICLWATYFFRTDVIIVSNGNTNRVSDQVISVAKNAGNTFFVEAILFAKYQPIPLGNYIATIKNTIIRSSQPTTYFFLGDFYPEHRWYFLPVNIFLKTPLPLLIFFSLSIVFMIRNEKFRKKVVPFFIPIVVIIGFSSISPQMPWVRYSLPLYPFGAIISAVGVREIKGKYGRLGVGILLLWYIFGTLSQFPHFISYANELVGQNKYFLFTDSNIDWGQSLPDLAQYLKQAKPRHVSFSYFGRDNGNNYGLVSNRAWGSYKFEEICAFHEISYPENSGKNIVAISISNWYGCGYYLKAEFRKENIKQIIGESILVFTTNESIH